MTTTTDIAKRVYDHTWKLDPIVRSLLDTDFYKLLMLQMIWRLHPDIEATFSIVNRTRSVRIADEIDETELRAQLDHARTLHLTKKEMIWLAGNSFYGRRQIFAPDFHEWFQDFALPEYEVAREDGQYALRFHGPWTHTTMWEIPALAIISELRARAAMRELGRFTLDVLYARAKAKLWSKVERLAQLPELRISDFGTRRHELPMVLGALAQSDAELKQVPYRVLQDWQRHYGGNLLVVLPDAFGTAAFLHDAPDWVADWSGFRPDSAPPIAGGEMILAWWRAHGRDPREKLLVFSDALDVDTIEAAYRHFAGKVRMS